MGEAFLREVETRRQVFSLVRRVAGTVQWVATFFCEADGVIIRMQRETWKPLEAKPAIIYEGWERPRPSSSEYWLRGKLAYASFQGAKAFWESLSVLAGQRWDLTAVKVIGGDGADWVKQGLGYFAGAAYQLWRFHLARKIRDCLGGGQAFQRVYDVRNRPGRLLEEARDAVAAALDPEQEERARVLLDYRRRLEPGGLELRGLGGIESNVDKVISNRMKKRGMAWRLDGARNMLAVITLRANGRLRPSGEAISDCRSVSRRRQDRPEGRAGKSARAYGRCACPVLTPAVRWRGSSGRSRRPTRRSSPAGLKVDSLRSVADRWSTSSVTRGRIAPLLSMRTERTN